MKNKSEKQLGEIIAYLLEKLEVDEINIPTKKLIAMRKDKKYIGLSATMSDDHTEVHVKRIKKEDVSETDLLLHALEELKELLKD